MFHRLLYPSTLKGKILHSSLILYLCTSLIGCASPQKPTVKPPTAVARAMETRSFSKDMKTVLKASINALQDMDYTIDVLNSDIGLLLQVELQKRVRLHYLSIILLIIIKFLV